MADNPEILFYLLFIPHMLFALSIHEASHAGSAYLLGDDTAAQMGRVTLNPVRHIDPIGLIAFFIIHFGWAKPVPVNPARLNNPGRDNIIVSGAGAAANLLFGLILLLAIKLWWMFLEPGSEADSTAMAFLFIGAQLNIGLCFFNLIPVPPLDGSHILMELLPQRAAERIEPLMRHGWIILLVLFIGGERLGIPLLDYVIWKPMGIIMHGVLGRAGPANLLGILADFRFFG